jgi:hypothetical protein
MFRLRIAVATFGLAVTLLAALPSTASAHPATGDWSNNHSLCTTCAVRQGDIVGLWQTLLWADGLLAPCGSSGVDGHFGPVTRSATIAWQRNWNSAHPGDRISVDGIVGPQTWSRAESKLLSANFGFFIYGGAVASPLLEERTDGTWLFVPAADDAGGGGLFGTSHPAITFDRC